MRHKIKKVKSLDGTEIAYTVNGQGFPLVKTATYITHLEHDWDNPIWRPMLTELSRHHTLYRYDERGCGLSDWYVDDYSWERWVEDLKAVVDAEGLESFYLFGQSQGVAVAVAFAARYPQRVKKLVLYGGYARGWLHRDLTEESKREEQLIVDLIKLGWGKDNPAFRQFFTAQIMPEASNDRIQAFNELMKISSEPEIAAKLEREMHLSNVTEEAPQVQCPALILHALDDASVPFEESKLLSQLIPNSRLIRLDSSNHILQDNEPAWQVFWAEIYKFLEIETQFKSDYPIEPANYTRALRSILFTDIIDSTKLALQLGDRKWIEVLEDHRQMVMDTLVLFKGRVVKDTGDGFLMVFDSPSEALEFSKQILKGVESSPIDIRCGIHTAEIEESKEDIRGINVHIAARIMDIGARNEIVISAITKNLLLGSPLQCQAKGDYEIKGIAEKMPLFTVEVD